MLVSLRATEAQPGVRIAAVDNGKANALTSSIVEELAAAVDSIAADGALVITGRPGMFTGGLDLAVLAAGGEQAERLLGAMGGLLVKILEAPRPVVVAADGHAVAAGAMLMLVADVALVSDRPARLGFAEVANGLPLPAGAIELVRARALPAAVVPLTAHATLVGPSEAVALGLAAEVVAEAEVLDRAIDAAATLAALPADAYSQTKQLVNRPLVDKLTAR